MSEIYLIKLECDATPKTIIVGAATSKENADKMLERLKAEDVCWEYSVRVYQTDCLFINSNRENF